MKSTCPECGEECKVVPLLNDFDYAGTHCTHGRGGTHYPQDYGLPVSDCCEAYITDQTAIDEFNEEMQERELMKHGY